MDKPKTIKTCFIEGTFPELPASKAYVTGRGEGGSLRIAASRAMADLMKNKALRARRLHAAKLTVAFGFKVVEQEQA
jgi:hypothetical protein